MIKRFIIIVALLTTVASAAQEGTSSPYSFYGIGLTKFKGTVENQSMGGIRMFSDSIHLNLRNPGSYGRLKLTTFTVGGSHQSTALKTDDESESSRTTSLDYLAIGLPTGRLNFGVGLIPYTSVGYRILETNEQTSNRFTGRGGMNKVFLTGGYAVNDNLSVGVDVNYNFGNIQNKFTTFQSGVQLGSRQINRTDLRGFSLNFGLDYQRQLNEKLKLYTVATYAPQMDITAEKMSNLATVTFRADGSESVIEENDITFPQGDLSLPSELTIGAGIGASNKWFMGAEYGRVSASDYNFNSGNSFAEVQYDNASQYRLGGFYIPEYNSLTSYFSRVVYRAGLRFEETGLNLSNEGINEFGISFGVGLPAGRNFTNANIGIEYGQRGTTNSGLIQENFFKLSISLSLNDKWFVQRKFD
ncbi:membrane protein [Gillisia sp. JM1]|uniref:membrane protein n=1 Tax=Gillisia sp. JM1 TaxID=1283286 RepID=UPI0003FD0FF7|nr:membrane protein [Gillisia sp. JM1]